MADLLPQLLRGLMLAFQSGAVGGAVFAWLIAPKAERGRTRRLTGLAALAATLAAVATASALLSNLMAVLDLSLTEAVGAEFVRHYAAFAAAGLLAAWLCFRPGTPPLALVLAGAAMVAASATGGHASARLDGRTPLMAADFLHQLAAGIWLGGIPFLLLALRTPEGTVRIRICRRFSTLAALCVAVLLVTATALAYVHVGSWAGMVGSDFGARATVKASLLGVLLLLGLGNLLAGPRLDQAAPLVRLPSFAIAEMGLGLAVLMIAASLASQPPPAGLPGQVMPPAELLAQMLPHQWPRLSAAIPIVSGSFEDHAWAEMTHHLSGLMVLSMGVLAFLRPLPGFAWARHWPLLFLAIGIGIAAVLSDPDSWPWGPNGFWGKPGDLEVIEHRLAAGLVVVFGLSEWAVQTGIQRRRAAALVFPLACWLGGMMLMTHSHTNMDPRIGLYVHISHMTMALLGILAGAGRWIELSADERASRLAGRLWPLALALVGVLLILYREV